MCKIINDNYEFCKELINNNKTQFYETLSKVYFHDFRVQGKHISNLREKIRNIIDKLSLSNKNLELYNYIISNTILRKQKLDEPIFTSLFTTIKRFETLPRFDCLFENILNIEKHNPQSSREFVNIINYFISKQPHIFINNCLINFIIEKLNTNDNSVLSILSTAFEHWVKNDNNKNFFEEVLNKIKTKRYDFCGSEEFYAAFINFLNQHSKPINDYFTNDCLYVLVYDFLSITYKPNLRWKRIVKATIYICNYYYETNNKDKAIEIIKLLSQVVFPFSNKQTNNVNRLCIVSSTNRSNRLYSVNRSNSSDQGYIYERESNEFEAQTSQTSQTSQGSPFFFSEDNYSNSSSCKRKCFISIEHSNKSKCSISTEHSNKSESLSEDLNDYYRNSNDIYKYFESELHKELRKSIVEFQEILDIMKTDVKNINTDHLKNILKLYSILVLREEQEKLIIIYLKKIVQKLIQEDIEVIAKIIIFSSKPVESKEYFYVYIINMLEQKTMIDKEDVVRLFQEKFNIIYNDFNTAQIEFKRRILYFSNLLLLDSNSSSFENQINFYYKKYNESGVYKKLFIKRIILQYFQNGSVKNEHFNYNLDCLIQLIWSLLQIKEEQFPKNLKEYIEDDRNSRPIYLHLYLLQSFIKNIQNQFVQDLFNESVNILANSITRDNFYHKEILNFFIEALEIFAKQKEHYLYNLCVIPITFINKYNNALQNRELFEIYTEIRKIFTEKDYDISIHPIIEVLSLFTANEGMSFLNQVKYLDNIIRRIEYKDYENDQYFLWKIKHTIKLSENIYSSRNNFEMTYIASKKFDLFPQQRNVLVNIVQQAN